MKRKKVSIIIPIFNTAEYLRRCLDSCIYQTLSDIEIVAVVDGITNKREMEIITEYESTYPGKVRSVFLAESKGPAEARNEALRIAKGEYVIFVDSDDFIDFRLCEKVFNALKASGADIAVFEYYYMRGGILGLRQANDFSTVINNDDIPFYLNRVRCWFLMVKTAVIVDNGLFFTGFYGDDIASCLWYAASKKTIWIDEPLYYYAYREGSFVSEWKDQKFWMFVENYIDILKHPFFRARSVDFISAFSFFVINYLCGYWLTILINHKQDHLNKFCKILYDTANEYGLRAHDNRLWEVERVKRILDFFHYNNKNADFNERFIEYYEQLDFNIIKERLLQLKSILAGKNIVLWAAGHYGKIIANAMLLSEMAFEVTDIDAKGNMPGTSVSWDLLKSNADIVLVAGSEYVKGVRTIVRNDAAVYDFQKYLNGDNSIIPT